MDEADKLCDRIAIVDHGALKALDTPARLKAAVNTESLDDVFVHFTGRELRDGVQDPAPRDRIPIRR
jgi:ABC-2 type transport system ATP-binding protein